VNASAERGAAWQLLRNEVGRQASFLSAPQPPSSAAQAAGLCACCRGPARPGCCLCYHCSLYRECLPGLLPDVVAPVAYAPKGSKHASSLWIYKSARPDAGAARGALTALLLVFLRDHGGCVWRRAGMARPTHVAVVPSRRTRPGTHPLQALAAPYLALPWLTLRLARSEDPDSRDPDPCRFRAERTAGASVLLLDDTWTSGASATSAAAALRIAGARSVALIVLGRHLDAAAAADGRFSPAAMPFCPALCAVHAPAAVAPCARGGPAQ
jgi:hypothetical protein